MALIDNTVPPGGESPFGKRLNWCVKVLRGLSGREFANQAEVSAQAMSHYITGRSQVSSALLARFAQLLQVDANYLLGLTDNPHLDPDPSGSEGDRDQPQRRRQAS